MSEQVCWSCKVIRDASFTGEICDCCMAPWPRVKAKPVAASEAVPADEPRESISVTLPCGCHLILIREGPTCPEVDHLVTACDEHERQFQEADAR